MEWQKIVDKCQSGRWILTVICGLTFSYLACTGKIEAAAVMTIIGAVFTAYFDRKDRTPPATGGAIA